jgi:hypothetical protein
MALIRRRILGVFIEKAMLQAPVRSNSRKHIKSIIRGEVNMSSHASALNKIKSSGKKAVQKAEFNPIVEVIARLGYGVRGLIYLVMGLLSILFAIGAGGAAADQQGAIAVIGKQPAGLVLLWVVLAGLVCYSLWGLIRAFLDPLHKGKDAKGLMERGGFLVSAIAYIILIIPTYSIISGGSRPAHNGAQTDQTQHSVAKILTMSWGRWAIGILGIIVVAVGLYQIYQGFKLHWERQIQPHVLSHKQAIWVKRTGQFGTMARGVVFALLGLFLVFAAYYANPNQAQGFDGALMSLMRQPYGTWLMGIVALGLAAFGVYSIFVGLWFRLTR